jgi:xylulokinase
MAYFAGIDLGTTGCKACVFESRAPGLVERGKAYIEYDLLFTKDGVEQDAGLWWEQSKAVLREALKNAGVDGQRLAALAVSSQGIASVPVNKKGEPLANARSWYDHRADAEAAEMAQDYGAEWFFRTTGRQSSSLFFPQVLHIKRHNPGLYENAQFFLMAQDYLLYRFCGKALSDYTMASGTLCFDVEKKTWIKDMFDRYGIDMQKFPALKPFGSRAGTVLPEVATELGLSPDCVVGLGMQDQKAAALGAGIAPGIVTVSIGTASAISVLSDKRPDAQINCHAFDGKSFILENYVGASGASLKWLKQTLFPGLDYAEIDALALRSRPGANGLRFNPGLDEGKGAFSHISLNSSNADMARAVLEGVARGIKGCIDEQKQASPGLEIQKVCVFGSGAKSKVWRDIIADTLQMPLVLPEMVEAANAGAALCAQMAFENRRSI